MGPPREAADMEEVRNCTENLKHEADIFAMRAFYKGGRLTEGEVRDFFRKLGTIIRSIRRC